MARMKAGVLCHTQNTHLDEPVKHVWQMEAMKVVDDAIGSSWTMIANQKKDPDIRGQCKCRLHFPKYGDYVRRHYTPGHLKDKDAVYHEYKTATYYFTSPESGEKFYVTIEARVYDASKPRDKLARRLVVGAMKYVFKHLKMTNDDACNNLRELLSHVS